MRRKDSLLIIGLDPSSDNTGIAVTHYSRFGHPQLLAYQELIAVRPRAEAEEEEGVVPDNAMFERLADIKRQIVMFMRALPQVLIDLNVPNLAFDDHGYVIADLLAFESPQAVTVQFAQRRSTRVVNHAIGAYLPLSCFTRIDKVRIGTLTAAAVYGACGKPTPQKKQMAITWANYTFRSSLNEPLTDKQDAIADALVACELAARQYWNRSILETAAVPIAAPKAKRQPSRRSKAVPTAK